MDLKAYVEGCGLRAREAAAGMARLSSATKERALLAMADAIGEKAELIKAENSKDLAAGKENGLSSAMLDRLELTDKRIDGMITAVREIAAQSDPVGTLTDMTRRPSGIQVGKMTVPIGVVGIIYESRPNVTADAAALCLKAGNACILRGGKEAFNSNMVIAKVMSEAGTAAGLPADAMQLIEVTERETVTLLAQAEGLVDLIIPRGGEGLIRAVVNASRVPVIKHYNGICHTYVDSDADLDMAADICFNAKVQRPGVCNAMETMLVHADVAAGFLPVIVKKLEDADVELRGCEKTRAIAGSIGTATEEDWGTEYVDLILSVKVVDDIDEAIRHIRKYGSAHTDAIVTGNIRTAAKFVNEVDSSSVMVNASSRFSDGGEYGLGAEIGISTDKLHARGPMGAAELTTYKWIVYGEGTIRQ